MSFLGVSTGRLVELPGQVRPLVSGAAARRVLTVVEPLLPLAAEAAGLGALETAALGAGVRVVQRRLAAGDRPPACPVAA